MAYQSSQKDITCDIKMQRIGNLLSHASRSDRVGINLMLREGISPNVQDYDNKTALHLAGSEGHDSIVELLLHYKVDVNITDRWHKTGKETNKMTTMGNRENITGDSSSSTGERDEWDDSR
ncbi:integrin-linked protein kinase 1 [Lactuca sativa]|uniref:Uncharacterized protein n=1 Tax=Lactuca sativa TaxID=4236 RepID=A0A9R1XCK7_LACSA|nr:integrin-linked protein kinase 1 [Lactuca sativa]XP_023746277.1 integrin-linked protein kinase 1 [Lactuca sativa]KAJ0209350.1 hypothetical protein LSAT_V11C400163910 [Lactuca sativa]